MVIAPHQLIELAFTTWNVPASKALIKQYDGERTNIPKARHLAYYLMHKYTDLSVREMSLLFDDFHSTAKSGLYAATVAIESNFITWQNQVMKQKYAESVRMIGELNQSALLQAV